MRWTNPLNEAAAERDNINGAWFASLDLPTGFVRVNDSGIDVEWGGFFWSGIGDFGSFDGIEESVDFIARGVRLQLTGINPGLNSAFVDEVYQGRAIALYVGLFDEHNVLIADPELAWDGFIDTAVIEEEEKASRLVLSCEHELRNFPPCSRFSDADQKSKFSDDRFFEWAHRVRTYTSQWGNRSTTYGNQIGGGYGPVT